MVLLEPVSSGMICLRGKLEAFFEDVRGRGQRNNMNMLVLHHKETVVRQLYSHALANCCANRESERKLETDLSEVAGL